MFLQRYNLWGKTKREQLQSWNILLFDPKKTDVDDHVDLINTLGDKVDQKEEAKKEKFIETMPTMIQTHLIILDKEEGKIPPPFKGAKPKQTRGRGKPKGKPQDHRQNPPQTQEADETYVYDSPNNYYHNDNYTALSQNHGHRPFNGEGGN